MHATTGRSTTYLWPSYFCATYGKYGPKNPTGCHCHRVRHEVLERIVKAYLAETKPKIAQLLEATATGNLKAARPLLESLQGCEKRIHETVLDILEFIDEHDGDLSDEAGGTLAEVYGLLYERFRPGAEAAIAEKEAALDKMLEDYRPCRRRYGNGPTR